MPGNGSPKSLRTPGKYDCPQVVGEVVSVTGSPHQSHWCCRSDPKLREDFWVPTRLRWCCLEVIKKVHGEAVRSVPVFEYVDYGGQGCVVFS